MLENSKAFSGIGVDDLGAARRFYGETLAQRVEVLDEENGLMSSGCPAAASSSSSTTACGRSRTG